MDDGGNKSEFELEVNDKDVKVVSMDIDSAGDVDADLPTDGADVVEGDLPAPDEDPGDKPAEPEKPVEESSGEDELDSELEALEACL